MLKQLIPKKSSSNPVDYIKKYKERFNEGVVQNFSQMINSVFTERGGSGGAAAFVADNGNSVFT